jgi:hypothetical protein
MVACEVQFTPQVTPLVLVTAAGSPHAFGTIGPAGTPSPLEASATAEAEIVLTMVAWPRSWSPPTTGDPRVASYEEAWCGDIERVCYELCYQSQCGTYEASNPRVDQFIAAVDARESMGLEFASKDRTLKALNFAAFGSCVGTVVAGGGVYALVTALDPEPVSKIVLAGVGAVAAGSACIGSLVGRGNVNTDRSELERERSRQALIAEQAFTYLEDYGEEVDLDAAP